MSLGELARRASVPKASLVDWETGRHRPPGTALDRLLSALEIDARDRLEPLARTSPREAQLYLSPTVWGAPVDLGQLLRALRLRRGMRQEDVANALGIRQGTFAKWESGESTPADEARERAFDVLGATDDERAILLPEARHGGQGAEPGEARTLEGIEERLAWIAHDQPVPMRDVLLLGIESELWWRATRESAADALLGQVMAVRAQQALVRGVRSEIAGHAQRAVRLARDSGELDRATPAVYAVNWIRQRTPDGAVGAARSLGSWRERLRNPVLRDWLTASQGLALVRAGATDAGVELIERLVREAEESWADLHYRKDLVEAWLIAGEPGRAREAFDAMAGEPCEITRAKVAAASGEKPSPDVLDRLRAAPDWLGRHEATRIERLAAKARRGLPARLD